MTRVAALALLLLLAACSNGDAEVRASPPPPAIRINELQVVGTHNSYHRRMPDKAFEALRGFDARLADSVDYEHQPLGKQLDAGVRQLELDVFADPNGGLFATRVANPIVGLPKESGIPELASPGFKVLHIQEIDYESSCLTFVACLEAVKAWSDAHPRHVPITILVEGKEGPIPDPLGLGFVTPVPIRSVELNALQDEILSVFGVRENRVVTPADVGEGPARWPLLEESRGKVLFILISEGPIADAYGGGLLFALGDGDVASRPDPIGQAADIRALAEQGVLVRTRADADTVEARTGDTARRDAALAGAAHLVSTDYPVDDPRFEPDYVVAPAIRCNPVTASPMCISSRLEPPSA